jgi:hypothetical protein
VDQLAQPEEVSDVGRLVQIVELDHLFALLGGHGMSAFHAAALGESGVDGRKPEKQKREQRDAEEGREQKKNAADEVSRHQLESSWQK